MPCKIVKAIHEEKLVVGIDVSLKDNVGAGHCYMCNEGNSVSIEDSIMTNSWDGMTLFCAEAKIMLELLNILIKYVLCEVEGKVTMLIDNKRVKNIMSTKINKTSMFSGDGGDIIGIMVKSRDKLIKINVKVRVKKVLGHPEQVERHEENPES